ncbi:hypothetical protein BD413DRAFT_302800 [Trametes elegans]|nr:hypothetical protein BD413DRAFT_302800 [Trametes elegans]
MPPPVPRAGATRRARRNTSMVSVPSIERTCPAQHNPVRNRSATTPSSRTPFRSAIAPNVMPAPAITMSHLPLLYRFSPLVLGRPIASFVPHAEDACTRFLDSSLTGPPSRRRHAEQAAALSQTHNRRQCISCIPRNVISQTTRTRPLGVGRTMPQGFRSIYSCLARMTAVPLATTCDVAG